MESLGKEQLLRDLDQFGYHLVQPQAADVTSVLSRMLQSNDGRVLEGVPVVLTQALFKDQKFDLASLEKSLPNSFQKRFRILAAVTFYFLFWAPNSEQSRDNLRSYLRQREPAILEDVQNKLSEKKSFNVGEGVKLDSERLENTYKNYVVNQFMHTQENLTRKVEEQRQVTLLDALSELFTERQRDLLMKLLKKEELTKTEREYYSRTVKPRLKALRNTDLQALAATLLGF